MDERPRQDENEDWHSGEGTKTPSGMVGSRDALTAANNQLGHLVQKDSLLGCAYSTAGRDKVYDQGKRILCTLDGTGEPMAIESRKVNCRRPLMAVTEMTDCGRWVFSLDHQRQGFRTGQKIEFTPTPGGWDLTMKLVPPERANKALNKAIEEISVKKREPVEARDSGAITDTDGLVRIMGCDPFRRLGFSP